MTIKELIEKRAKVWETAKNFVETHEKEGVLSEEDTMTYNKMEKEIGKFLTMSIERQQRALDRDHELVVNL